MRCIVLDTLVIDTVHQIYLIYNTSAISFICIMWKNIDRHGCAVIVVSTHDSRIMKIMRVVEENHDHRYIVMEMPSYALLNFLYVIKSNLSFPRGLLKGSSHQSLGYPLQILFLMSHNKIICIMNRDVKQMNLMVINSSWPLNCLQADVKYFPSSLGSQRLKYIITELICPNKQVETSRSLDCLPAHHYRERKFYPQAALIKWQMVKFQ